MDFLNSKCICYAISKILSCPRAICKIDMIEIASVRTVFISWLLQIVLKHIEANLILFRVIYVHFFNMYSVQFRSDFITGCLRYSMFLFGCADYNSFSRACFEQKSFFYFFKQRCETEWEAGEWPRLWMGSQFPQSEHRRRSSRSSRPTLELAPSY